MNVANTILAQLGGNKFLAMTGAGLLAVGPRVLQFKIGRGAKDGINAVRIELEDNDTYTVRFYKIGSGFDVKVIREVSQVYADSLRNVFTATTGLDTSL